MQEILFYLLEIKSINGLHFL